MKAKNFFFLLGLGAVLLTSCNSENEMPAEKPELSITTSWATSVATKAIKADFAVGDELGLFITSGSLDELYNKKPEYANVSSTWSGTNWAQRTNVYLDNKEATIYAYYPLVSTAGNGKTIPVESSTQTDYLFGKSLTKATIATPSANIEMKHALAQVAFRISTRDYSGNGRLTEVKVSNTGAGNAVYVKGNMNCQTGTVTGTEIGTLTLSANNTLSTTVSVFSAITMPISPTTGKNILLTFKIDDVNYVYTLSAGTVWLPGTKNVYTIVLKGKNIEIGGDAGYGQDGVDIKDWNEVINGEIELTPII